MLLVVGLDFGRTRAHFGHVRLFLSCAGECWLWLVFGQMRVGIGQASLVWTFLGQLYVGFCNTSAVLVI